jgi:DNA (cytosine-5)-methyltransferase 1
VKIPHSNSYPVIDLFAGPGGLGEGFSQLKYGKKRFKISLSIEKDFYAHETLMLRSFFRNFKEDKVPDEYYQFLRGEITRHDLYGKYPDEFELAQKEAWHCELGKIDENELDEKITKAIKKRTDWVLIGGPPCQAYSIVGRSRNKANKNYIPEKDNRHFLYKQYLRIIAYHWPSVFIMENVKGMLSSKIKGNLIFPKILNDLSNPAEVFNGSATSKKYRYRIFSLSKIPDKDLFNDVVEYSSVQDYIIKCEDYGIPQARHRVILLGIREDISVKKSEILKKVPHASVKKTIGRLPRLRSGFSKGMDNQSRWKDWLYKISDETWLQPLKVNLSTNNLYKALFAALKKIKSPRKRRGGEFISCPVRSDYLPEWYCDERLGGICNSTTRGHMDSDLYRYFFAACFAKVSGRSPLLSDFPHELLPNHKNAKKSSVGIFADRFRVQVASRPSTTIMSHISKDGHYYIHYDPTQCRTFTVREAARLQTFPDNYFFCGPRTNQYVQVGNAVPPFLAYQIAEIVCKILSHNKKQIKYG